MTLAAPKSLACRLAWLFALATWQYAAIAAEPSAVHSPVPPHETLQDIVVAPGLKVELVACEPAIESPVAMRFDEDGRLWVVQMGDYPTGSADGLRSRISVLEDRDGDGFFETAKVFADNLKFATGLQPWKGGVFVTMSGQLAYMKDTNGDGKADANEAWYTGFSELNTQLRANHPRLALDNHIYVASGLRGGEIADHANPGSKHVSLSTSDFRFDPVTREFAAVSGPGQFGLTFDDYGNRFVCSNRNPAIHVVLENRELEHNRLVAVPSVVHDVAKAAEQSHVYPITRAWTTSNLHAGQFTAACGVEVYRGDALPEDCYGNIFVCEPTGHLVHREIMRPDGATFSSTPATEGVDFLASRDQWFSPVNLEVGPDGALYVVDMYRAVIEHPEWVPDELKHRPDQLFGSDLGRIYRVVREGAKRGTAPRLSSASNEALVELLSHPNAWWRETAARLLLERNDLGIGEPLRQVAMEGKSPLGRIHALRLLEGLQLLTDEVILSGLNDSNPRIVEQAVIVGRQRVDESTQVRERISQLTGHDDARVRFEALLCTTALPQPPAHPADEWESRAMLLASSDRGGDVLANMLQHSQALEANVVDPKRFVADLARVAAATLNETQLRTAIEALAGNRAYELVGLTSLLSETTRRGKSLDAVRSALDDKSRSELDRALNEARQRALDRDQPDAPRIEAVNLLALSNNASELLLPLAMEEPVQAVRLRAISGLPKHGAANSWHQLLERFSKETPALQREIIAGMLTNAETTSQLLDEIANGRVKPSELDMQQANLLLNHKNTEFKARAQKLFADALPADRKQALSDYQVVLKMDADAERGRHVFEKRCSTCHRVDNIGTSVAPDISDSREKTAAQILGDIIQPNRAIDSNYFSYTVTTTDGRTHTGILTTETSTSITLKQAEGKTVTLSRDEIDELHSDGISFMPDGLEKNIPPQEMADLISFIKNWRYLEGR